MFEGKPRLALFHSGPFLPRKLSLAPSRILLHNSGMDVSLIFLCRLTSSFGSNFISSGASCEFNRHETRLSLVLTLLLISALLSLASLVVLPYRLFP